jgi:aminoglycoside 6'-N-acetyltransferase I
MVCAEPDGVGDFDDSMLPAATDLYVAVFNADPWNDKWSFESAFARLSAIVSTPGFVGVALREADNLVGFAVGHSEQWFVRRHFLLQEMCVATNMQRSGRGSRLMGALVDTLIAHDVEQLYLTTDRGGPAASFYARHGFRPASRTDMMLRRLD